MLQNGKWGNILPIVYNGVIGENQATSWPRWLKKSFSMRRSISLRLDEKDRLVYNEYCRTHIVSPI